jgi:Ser/Thr protein kinase RdoA (MazF antagonist)
VPPILGLADVVDGLAVTAWRRIEPNDEPIDWHAVGRFVRRVHELPIGEVPAGYPLPSPVSFPWWDFETLLGDLVDEIDEPAAHGLLTAIERHGDWRSWIGDDPVVCHGDVHPGNVLVSGDGPLLIDWDLLCVATPAWDHAMLTTWAPRWGGPAGTYRAFAEGYGVSLADDPLTRSIAELRNVAATLMRVRAGRTDPVAAVEADRRLRYWRGEPDAPIWRAQ